MSALSVPPVTKHHFVSWQIYLFMETSMSRLLRKLLEQPAKPMCFWINQLLFWCTLLKTATASAPFFFASQDSILVFFPQLLEGYITRSDQSHIQMWNITKPICIDESGCRTCHYLFNQKFMLSISIVLDLVCRCNIRTTNFPSYS